MRRAIGRLLALGLAIRAGGTYAREPETAAYYTGDPGLALEQVRRDVGERRNRVRLDSLHSLVGEGATRVEGVTATRRCAGDPVSNETVGRRVDLAVRLVLADRAADARAELDGLLGSIDCLDELAEGTTVARALFVAGVVDYRDGDPAAAEASWRDARRFAPKLSWDTWFALEPPPEFAASGASVEGEPARLWLPPTVGARAVFWVDGAPAIHRGGPLRLAPGEHLVQVMSSKVETFSVTLAPGAEAGLVVPGLIEAAEVAGSLALPETRRYLARITRAHHATDEEILVVAPGTTWGYRPSADAWVRFQPGPPRWIRRTAGPAGASLLVAGASFAAVRGARLSCLALYDPEDGTDCGDRGMLSSDVVEGKRRASRDVAIGLVSASAGLCVLAGGELVPRPGRTVPVALSAEPLPAGAEVRLTWVPEADKKRGPAAESQWAMEVAP